MRRARFLRLFLLLSCMVVGLVACEGKPDPTKNPVTAAMLLNDLPGQSISGLEGRNNFV